VISDKDREAYLLTHGWQVLLDELGGDLDALARLSSKHGVALGYRHVAYHGLSKAMASFNDRDDDGNDAHEVIVALDNWFQRVSLQIMDGAVTLDPVHESPLFDAVDSLLNKTYEVIEMTDEEGKPSFRKAKEALSEAYFKKHLYHLKRDELGAALDALLCFRALERNEFDLAAKYGGAHWVSLSAVDD